MLTKPRSAQFPVTDLSNGVVTLKLVGMHDGEKHRKDIRLEVRQRRHNRRFGQNPDMRQLQEPLK
jgi:hypothetical protein